MHQKINRWKKKITLIHGEQEQKSIKTQLKKALRSTGYLEYFLEAVKSQEVTDNRFG